MSASPAGHTPGRTPNGGVQKIVRKVKKTDALMQPARKKRPTHATQGNGIAPTRPNGNVTNVNGLKNMPHHLRRPTPPPPTLAQITAGSGIQESGFTARGLNPSNYTDYPLVTTKRALMEGIRHHVAKFASKRDVDPSDDKEFTRPVRLHRRDPRLPPGGAGGIKEEEDDGVPAEEREKRDRERAEKEAQRAADAAQIAPSADKGAHQRKIPFGKKVQTIYRNDANETKKAQSALRYEEALPWHLEDFDNKSTWVGSYEDAMSHQYAVLAHGEDGKFRMMPLEKWYKFTPKHKVKTYTAEEAEKAMNAKAKPDRWATQIEAKREKDSRERAFGAIQRGLYVGNTKGDEGMKAEQVDQLDFEEDMFADDEETPFLDKTKDADEKDVENRVKMEQLQANVFSTRDEKDADKEEEEEGKYKEEMKQFGRRVKKTIVKREKNYIYDSDDSSKDPYSESSESEDSETERLKEEERRKEESKAASDREKSKPSKNPSGASSRGTNTPSGRPSKHPLPSTKPSSSLKRPGSPNLSEASGNESTRKKHKKTNGVSSSQPAQPPSRPMSPSLGVPAPSIRGASGKSRSNAGSGSEGEGAGSGGEMSDGTKMRIKLKVRHPSKSGTPQMSRAGSPSAPPARIGTPANDAASAPAPLPSGEHIRSMIPPEGITVSGLLALYKAQGRTLAPARLKEFVQLMKANARFDKETKRLSPY